MAQPGAQFLRGVVGGMQPPGQGPSPIAPVVVGRGDARPFAGDSPLHPLDRLARYQPEVAERAESDTWIDPVRHMFGMRPDNEDRGKFRAVKRGDLADVPRAYVFVHGWVPGSRDYSEELFIEQGQTALAWDSGVANQVGRTLVELYEPLLAALVANDPQAAVLWYSWVDQSGTDVELFAARSSLTNTAINGRRLAAALTWLIGDGCPGLHLIGHSHGSVVATYAGLSLGMPIAQLTLLDCPEDWFSRAGGAAGLLPAILPRLRPGRGPRATFVDAYASMFGRSYHDLPGLSEVVDVRLAPVVRRSDPAAPVSQAHQFPVSWYAASVSDRAGGFAWSPLHGFDTATLGSAYLATGKGRLTELVRRRSGPQTSLDTEQVLTVLKHAPEQLTRRKPDLAYTTTLPEDSVALEFEISFERATPDARVDIAVNGQLVCVVYASAPLPLRGRFVSVAPGRATVQFRLAGPGLWTTATVSGLRLRRGPRAHRNLDETGAASRIAALGAVGGAALTATVFMAGLGLRAAVRRARSRGQA